MSLLKSCIKRDHVFILTGLALAVVIYSNDIVNADSTKVDNLEAVNLLDAVDIADVPAIAIQKEVELIDAQIDGIGFEIVQLDTDPYEHVVFSDTVPDGVGVCNSDNITGMSYRKTTDTKSRQYKLLNSPECYTDKKTGIRMVGDRYCIAIGSYYSKEIGTKINLVMENGSVVKCIMAEAKSDAHTDETHRFQKWDGSVAEFVFDPDVFKSSSQYPKEAEGRIARIEVVK